MSWAPHIGIPIGMRELQAAYSPPGRRRRKSRILAAHPWDISPPGYSHEPDAPSVSWVDRIEQEANAEHDSERRARQCVLLLRRSSDPVVAGFVFCSACGAPSSSDDQEKGACWCCDVPFLEVT